METVKYPGKELEEAIREVNLDKLDKAMNTAGAILRKVSQLGSRVYETANKTKLKVQFRDPLDLPVFVSEHKIKEVFIYTTPIDSDIYVSNIISKAIHSLGYNIELTYNQKTAIADTVDYTSETVQLWAMYESLAYGVILETNLENLTSNILGVLNKHIKSAIIENREDKEED